MQRPAPRPWLEPLEARILYSADLLPVTDGLGALHATITTDSQSLAGTSEIVFVDAGVQDHQRLVDDLLAQRAAGRNITVHVIEPGTDGLSFITTTLSHHQGVSAIHLVSHGEPGQVVVGNTPLDLATMMARASDVARWGAALGPNADLLLYGCSVGLGDTGAAWLQALQSLTGADVAASDDITGGALGDWVLEAQRGRVDTPVAMSVSLQSQWEEALAATSPSSPGTAVWSSSGGGPVSDAAWDGARFLAPDSSGLAVEWNVVTSATSADGDQALVVGVDKGGAVTGLYREGGTWRPLPMNPLATGMADDRQSFAVAFEQQSGQAMLVWHDGSQLWWSQFDGAAWSSAALVTGYDGAAPARLQLAVQPSGDAMVLGVVDSQVTDHAVLWDGSRWHGGVTLDTSRGDSYEQYALSVAYESTSGAAMLTYGVAGDARVHYVQYENGVWTTPGVLPFNMAGQVFLTQLAQDPGSDRIVLAASSVNVVALLDIRFDQAVAVWDGDAWRQSFVTSPVSLLNSGIKTAIGFESVSGDVLAVYSDDSTALKYRTLTASDVSWSTPSSLPALVDRAGVVRLFADPASNQLMLGVQETSGRLTYTAWTGDAFDTRYLAEDDTGSSGTPAFTWLWNPAPASATGGDLLIGPGAATSGYPGLSTVGTQELLRLGTPDFDLSDGGNGTLYRHWDPASLGISALDDIDWVSQQVRLPDGTVLQRGDLLLTVAASATLTSRNTVTAQANDIVLFRPDDPDAPGTGTFAVLIPALNTTGGGNGSDIRGLALVEQDVVLGDITLRAGDVLYTQGNGSSSRSVMHYSGHGGTPVNQVLLAADDLDVDVEITALEIIDTRTTVGGRTLEAGQLLVTLDGSDADIGSDGATSALDVQDIGIWTVTRSSVNGTASVSTDVLIDGNALGWPGVALDSLALRPDAAPVISLPASGPQVTVDVAERSTVVATVLATHAAGLPLVYAMEGGADAALFTLDGSTGEVRARGPLTFEAPQDADGDGRYELRVSATDGVSTDTIDLSLRITNTNQAPELATTTLTATEMSTGAGTVTATDPEGDAITYRIVGGADAALFSVDGATGSLSFIATPDTTTAPFAGHSPNYDLVIEASDGLEVSQGAVTVTLQAVNRPPVNTLQSTWFMPEDTLLALTRLAVADTDAGTQPLTVTLTVSQGQLFIDQLADGGLTADAIRSDNDGRTLILEGSAAAINVTLSANDALFYMPRANSHGEVTLTMVTDDRGASGAAFFPTQTTSTATISIESVNDAPVWSNHQVDIVQGGVATPAIAVSDADHASTDLRFEVGTVVAGRFESAVSGAAVSTFTLPELLNRSVVFVHDGSATPPSYTLFAIDPEGGRTESSPSVTFNATPQITSLGGADTATVSVTEPQTVVTTVQAQDREGQALQFSLTGGADRALFQIDEQTGELRFSSPPDTQTPPTDRPGGLFEVVVAVSDGRTQDEQNLQVQLIAVNRAPVNTLPATFAAIEDQPLVLTGLQLNDVDAGDEPLTVSLTVDQGTLAVRSDVAGGVSADGIAAQPDGRSITLRGTVEALNTTLAAANGLVFTPTPDMFGTVRLTLVSDDHGAQGAAAVDGVTSDTDEALIEVAAVADQPVVTSHRLDIAQGQTAPISLEIGDPDSPPEQIELTASSTQAGRFIVSATGDTATTFTWRDALDGVIVFQHDGSPNAPAYELSVTDGVTEPQVARPLVGFTPSPEPESPAPVVPAPIDVVIIAPSGPGDDAGSNATATEDTGEGTPTDDTKDSPNPQAGLLAMAPTAAGASASTLALGLGLIDPADDPVAPQRSTAVPPLSFNAVTPDALARKDALADGADVDAESVSYRWSGRLTSSETLSDLGRNLERLRDELEQIGAQRQATVAGAIAVSTGLSVGYVIWLLRGGALIGSMLSSMPLWNALDPLPVLSRAGRVPAQDTSPGDDSPVDQLFDDTPPPPPPPPHATRGALPPSPKADT